MSFHARNLVLIKPRRVGHLSAIVLHWIGLRPGDPVSAWSQDARTCCVWHRDMVGEPSGT